MGLVRSGGYVVSTSHGAYARSADLDEEKLKKIAEILGIPAADRDNLISQTRSIYLYRGGTRPSGGGKP